MARGLFSVSNLVKEQEANKNVASLFLKRINEAIIKLDPDIKPSNYYKPSSLMCVRQMYFTRKGVEPEEEAKDPSMIGICESGTDRHDRIQHVLAAMKDLGMEFEYIDVETYVKEHNLVDIEVKEKKGMETKCFNKRYNISFLTDGIIRYIPTNTYYIFEFKTEVTQKFAKRDEQEKIHETQAAAYALSFGISDTLFVYEDRNFTTKKCFLYHVSEEDKRTKVVNKIEACEKCLKENKIPPKITNKDIDPTMDWGLDRVNGPSAKVCQYCKYKRECQKYL
ncbi:MAG: hypothetical protein ACI3T9_01040 [Romboutsia timonensis]